MNKNSEKHTARVRQIRSKTLVVMMAMQLLIFALVFHLWMDMMGNFEAGGKIAGFIMMLAVVLLISPNVYNMYREYTKTRGEA